MARQRLSGNGVRGRSAVPVATSLLKSNSGLRRAKTLTGRGTQAPGYSLIGTGKGRAKNSVQQVRIAKVVSPLTGQGPAKVGGGGRYANMNNRILNTPIIRTPRAVAPNSGSNVVRPPKTAVRILNGRGTGVVRSV